MQTDQEFSQKSKHSSLLVLCMCPTEWHSIPQHHNYTQFTAFGRDKGQVKLFTAFKSFKAISSTCSAIYVAEMNIGFLEKKFSN